MNNQKIMDKVDKALPVILKFVNSKPIKAIKDGFTKEFDTIVINPEESHSFEAKEI